MIEPRAQAHAASRMSLLWLLTCGVACWAGCGVYDPMLVESHDQAQRSAGNGSSAADGGSLPGDARCDEGQSKCGLPHAEAVCVSGRCLIVRCDGQYADCDEQAVNGCETDLASAEHCGLCNTACRFSHAAGRCEDGNCVLGTCDETYDDCDDDTTNGCEHKVDSLSDCGACGQACDKPSHGTAACEQGVCGIGRCDPGWGDCNADTADGCEQLLTSAQHCGACDAPCSPAHTRQSDCQSGQCVVRACTDGYADCNGDPADGCEANLAVSDSCGACGAACDLPHVADTRCVLDQGAPYCSVDHTCSDDGDVRLSQCADDASLGCARGYADCDGSPYNGCETDLSRLSSCGNCRSSCVQAHATTACQDGRCSMLRCDAGYGACDDSDQCQSLLRDPRNCGACGNSCDDATEHCVGGRCTASNCDDEHADCDGNTANGCETSLTSVDSCGGCEARCGQVPHAQPTCRDGACAIERCDRDYADCDGDPRNGCEVDLHTLDDCGACGKVCAFAHSQARCTSGVCERAACDEGYADCNGDEGDGCETDVRLPDNCGTCGNFCRELPNVAGSTCEATGCVIQCQTGRGDCDGVSMNGCEASLGDVTSCGRCGTDCSRLAHVSSARCIEGACSSLVCDDGFADCNGNAADGCERALDTLSDCGACDKPCAVAHARAECRSGTCTAGACDDGFGDCDGDPSNGCETMLNAPEHCGTCDTACSEGTTCTNGACGCLDDSQCAPGLSCCDGRCVSSAGSCFPFPCIPSTQLPDNALNCGACGQICLGWCCDELL